MRWFFEILLVLTARGLLYVLSVPLFILGVVFSCNKKGGLAFYLRQLALTLDVLGNVLGGPVWNKLLIKDKNAQIVKFGSRYDTISFVLAMNRHNLSRIGRTIVNTLETLDPGHMNKAVLNP